MFRCTNKALTITGYTLDPAIRELSNINKVIKWGLIWGERRKAAAAEQATSSKGNGFDSSGCRYSIDEIEQIVREGPPAGANRVRRVPRHRRPLRRLRLGPDSVFSRTCEQHPEGIGSRYLAEGRLGERSPAALASMRRPSCRWAATAAGRPRHRRSQRNRQQPDQPPDNELDDPELDDDPDGDDLGEELPKQDPNLPRLYAHGDPDARPLKTWLIKRPDPAGRARPAVRPMGYRQDVRFLRSRSVFEHRAAWLGHVVKRQCGVLLIAAEGADEVRLRLDAVVREKCGNITRAPFRWYRDAPLLLQQGRGQDVDRNGAAS